MHAAQRMYCVYGCMYVGRLTASRCFSRVHDAWPLCPGPCRLRAHLSRRSPGLRAVRPLTVVIAALGLAMGIYAEVAGDSMTASRRLVLIVPCSKIL